MNDFCDEQKDNGILPCIIPTSVWGYDWANGVDWTSAVAIIPWEIYRFYGDTTLLRRMYGPIKKICLLYRIHINQSSYRRGTGRLGTCTLKKQYNLDFLYLLLYGRLYSSQSSQTFRICRRCLLL